MSAPLFSSPARRRWLRWLLLPTVALSVFAWFDDANPSLDEGRGKRARRMPVDAAQVVKPEAVATADSRLAQAVERLELPSAVMAGKGAQGAPAVAQEATRIDLLSARSWYVAPPPLPPEAPRPPALPFRVVGQIIEGDAPAVFLATQSRNHVAREGDRLDNTYLVERIEKNRMTLIYLPLSERQYLTLGAVN